MWRRWILPRRRRDASLLKSRGFSVEGAATAEEVTDIVESEEVLGAWKWVIRKRVLDLLGENQVCDVLQYRYPRFPGIDIVASEMKKLPAFQAATCVYCQPDFHLKQVRVTTLHERKKLLVPCFRKGNLVLLDPAVMPVTDLQNALLIGDHASFGQALERKPKLKVDLVVLASMAVDPKTGARLGKGDGLADMEYAVLRQLKAIDDSTLIVTAVHELQLVDDLPAAKMHIYDVPADIIITPNQVIETNTTIPRPTGVYWHRLPPNKLGQYPILCRLKKAQEKLMKKPVELGVCREKLPKLTHTMDRPAIFISKLNPGVTTPDVQDHLKRLGVDLETVSLYRTKKNVVARVLVPEGADIDEQVGIIDKTELKGWRLVAKCDWSFKARGDGS